MNIEKIDVKKIRGKWSYTHSTDESIISDSGDDTISSIKIVANKINEIIDVLNEKQKDCYCSDGYSCKNCCDRQEQEAIYLKKKENSEEEKTITISTSEEQCEYCEYCGCGRMGNIFIHDLKKETTTPWIPKEVDNYYYIYNINGFNNKLTIGNEKFLGEHMDIKHFHFKNDWEKEFDKISINLENIFQQIENYERDGVEVFEVKDYIKKIKQFIRNLLK